jgi:CheY-like chemotaxis protein
MDDEEALRMTVGHALRRMGCLVELVPDGGAAVAAYSRARAEGQPFAVVLLDLSVREGMGGLEAMQQLQSSDPEVKAIVMSGYSQNAVLLEYQRHGFKGALAKPFTSSALSEALTRALGAVPASG